MYSPKGKEEKYGTFGFAFTITRALQALCLICILGMSANFIGEINAVDTAPPSVLIATLSIVCQHHPPLYISSQTNLS